MRIFAQYPIEAAAARWRQYFAFEKIQSPKKFDSMEAEKRPRQICKPEIESPKTALVNHMMNGQHGLERQPLRMHKHWHQRGSPVVCMQNLQLRRQSAS